MQDIEKTVWESQAKEHRITVGQLREQLSNLDNDCVICLGLDDVEIFLRRNFVTRLGENDNPTQILLELSTAENSLAPA